MWNLYLRHNSTKAPVGVERWFLRRGSCRRDLALGQGVQLRALEVQWMLRRAPGIGYVVLSGAFVGSLSRTGWVGFSH